MSGGLCDTFLTTHWSMVEGIQHGLDRDRALIGLLLERYWKPVCCCLRCKGYDSEQAKDLTQGFFHEMVLCRDLVQRADPSKGRFRASNMIATVKKRFQAALRKRLRCTVSSESQVDEELRDILEFVAGKPSEAP